MSTEREPTEQTERRFIATMIFLFVILQGLGAYGFAALVVSDVAGLVAGPGGVSSGVARFFFSQDFLFLVLRAVNTHIASTMFVQTFATLYLDKGLFRARAMATLAGLRKRTVPSFFKAVAGVSAYVAVFWVVFRLLDLPAQFDLTLMLLGGAPYLAGTVGMAAVCQRRLACAVPVVLEDASDTLFANMRRGLALIGAGKFCAAAAVFALLDGIFVAVAVLPAFPSQALAAGTAINAVLCTLVAVTLVATPLLYLCSATTAAHLSRLVLPAYRRT